MGMGRTKLSRFRGSAAFVFIERPENRQLRRLFPFQFFQPEASRGRPRRISRQKFPKRTRVLSIPSKPHSFHSVHSAIGSRMNGMIFRSFRKRNSSQKNTDTVYSEYSYSGIVPKERALSFRPVFHFRTRAHGDIRDLKQTTTATATRT